MRLILLGAPGCGKGTLAGDIVKCYNYVHISTGQILRQNIAEETTVGKIAKNYIDKGHFVPDEIVIEILKNKLDEIGNDNFILDGFPRNLFQAQELSKIAKIDKVILIDVDYSVIINRITGRRICSDCGRIFNTNSYKEIECDICKGILLQRADDTEEVIRERIKVYEEQTKPLIDYYKNQGLLCCLKAGSTPQETFQKFVKDILEK